MQMISHDLNIAISSFYRMSKSRFQHGTFEQKPDQKVCPTIAINIVEAKVPSFHKRSSRRLNVTADESLRKSSRRKLSQHSQNVRTLIVRAARSLLLQCSSSRDFFDDGSTVSVCGDDIRMMTEAKECDFTGNNLFRCGYYKEALTSYSKALTLKRECLKVHMEEKKPEQKNHVLASIATSINNIGYLRQSLGNSSSDEIMESFQNALQIKMEVLGTGDVSVGTTLNNIGSVYFKNCAYQDAIGAYEKSLEIMISHLGEDHIDIATVHSNISDVYLATNDLEKAKIRYNLALDIRWPQLNCEDRKVTRLLEKIASIDMVDLSQRRMLERSNSEDFEDSDWNGSDKSFENDLTYVEEVTRNIVSEMFQDRIEFIRGMRSSQDKK
mmetsp:Transcript_11134/g.17193  ORF Transcript_11134/g.17193 Transcript_11134/m.17193 type:complete len:383 (+) Transcript_11134:27-1175(+)